MPVFPKLDPESAELLGGLYPAQPEHMDLVAAFLRWKVDAVELTPVQVERVLSAIRKHAIPPTRLAVARARLRPDGLWEDARRRLARWESLEALLAQALPPS